MPMSSFWASPFYLEALDSVSAKVLAHNERGWSAESTAGAGATVETVPVQMTAPTEASTSSYDHVDIEWTAVVSPNDGDSSVVAFCNYWLVADEVHLLNIATHPEARRRGHARRLMDHLLAFARENKCRYVTLEVRRSNTGAQELYRSYGFEAVGVRPNYYVEDREDAIVMLLELPVAASAVS